VGNFQVAPGFSDDVVVMRVYPGPFNTLKNSLQPPLRGAVLQTFGAGNAPTDPQFLEILQDAFERGIVLVNVTQCVTGTVEAHYATGRALSRVGVVAGGDMTPEVALVKLGWLLGTGHTPEQVRSLMAVDMRGEMTSCATKRSMSLCGGAMRSLCFAVREFELSKAAECKLEDPNTVAAGNSDSAKWRASVIPMLLCAAASAGDLSAIQVMVSDGAAAGSAGYDQRTPLHLAATAGQTAVVRFLLEQVGVDHSPVDCWGKSPLMDAVHGQHRDVIELLVAAGAQYPHGPLGSFGISPNLTATHLQRLTKDRFPMIHAPDTSEAAGTLAARGAKRSRHR
jgi:lysophospholipase